MALQRTRVCRPRKHDLAGERFGLLVVVRREEGVRKPRWECRCDCGTVKCVPTDHLTRKTQPVRSCGCSQRRHGMYGTPEYDAWRGMIERCENPNAQQYPNYGARGITMCTAWRADFAAFYQDLGPRPGPEYSIDRIDVNGNYEPGNVRWATQLVQARNKRSNHVVEIEGERATVSEWAERTGVGDTTIRQRLRRGVTGRALIAPVRKGAA